ncbi:MAG: hypothetical protein K1Y36_00305 [Blastocatellia bacterium]|nr:hypothetical protein [Blastocatellia bacterium]
MSRSVQNISGASMKLMGSLVLSGVCLLTACGEAPQPVSKSESSQPAPAGYGAPPQQAAPATAPATGQPEAAAELPPVPESIQKLEKEYSAKSGDAKVKAELAKAKLDYGNELMFKSALPPKIKYRAALKMYREVLALDPANEEALKNKAQIEDIYKSMGRPVPS